MPESPIGGVVRNLVALQRLANGVSVESREEVLQPLFNEIAAEIARVDPGSETARALREGRIEDIMSAVTMLSDDAFARLQERLEERLGQIGVQQGRWAGDQLARAVGEEVIRATGIAIEANTVSPGFVQTIIEENPFEGKVLAEWVETQRDATVERVRRQIQLGMTNEETLGDIVRRVRGTRQGNRFVGGVLEATTRETEAITRTAINHVANRSHERTYESNSDVVRELEYTATLDSRTTLICAGLDGQTWEIGSDDIRKPPQHYGCRSVLMPVIDWEGIGVDPPEAGRRPAKTYDAEKGDLQETGAKQVSARTDYESWFRDQPAEVQNEIIGPTRARLFRDGKIDFREMVTRDGRTVEVKDLPGGEEALKKIRSRAQKKARNEDE